MTLSQLLLFRNQAKGAAGRDSLDAALFVGKTNLDLDLQPPGTQQSVVD